MGVALKTKLNGFTIEEMERANNLLIAAVVVMLIITIHGKNVNTAVEKLRVNLCC